MPNWVAEAKRKAFLDAEKERQKLVAENLARQQEFENNLKIFHQYTDQTRKEITEVLHDAQKQGLFFTEHEGYSTISQYDGYFLVIKERILGADDDGSYPYYHRVWGVTWTIMDPTYKKPVDPNSWRGILGSFLRSENKHETGRDPYNLEISLFLKFSDREYFSSITAETVKETIKTWLYNLYSR